MEADLIVFDFDGTLCDSTHVKTEAFSNLYADQGSEVAALVLEHHISNQGVSRFDKIRWVEEQILGRACTDAALAQRAEAFADLVWQGVLSSPLFPGVREYLETSKVPLALASATPEDELRRIIDHKGIAGSFAHVGGSPTPKGDVISAAISKTGARPRRTVMVGDQPSDVAAAETAGCLFIGMAAGAEAVIPEGTPAVDGFDRLDAALAGLLGPKVGGGLDGRR